MSTFVRSAALVVAAGTFSLACKDSGPASAVDIGAFCVQLSAIVATKAPCNTMALEAARLADEHPTIRLSNREALLRAGTPKAEERRAYDGCLSARAALAKMCAGKMGAQFALRAIDGDSAPGGGSAEAWVKKGNRTDSGAGLVDKALGK